MSTTPRRLTPFMARRKIEKACSLAEKACVEIETVLRECPDTVPDDLIIDMRDAQVYWHRQVCRLRAHVDPAKEAKES